MKQSASRSEVGFTLTELMVTIAIIAILAAVAAPSFSGDNNEEAFDKSVQVLAQDLKTARHAAAADPFDHAIVVDSTTVYRHCQIDPALPSPGEVILKNVQLPPQVKIQGVLFMAAAPGASYSAPSSGNGIPTTIRFTAVGPVVTGPATIFLQDDTSTYRARIVVYGTTGYIKVVEGW